RLAGAGRPHETHFIGFVFMFLAIGSAVWFAWHRPWRAEDRGRTALAFVAASAALALLVSDLGGGMALWRLVHDFLPGASGIRDVRRISVVVNLGLLASGALFLDYLVRCGRRRTGRIVLTTAVFVALLENCTLLALVPAEKWREWDRGRRFGFYDQQYGMYSRRRDWYGPQSAEMAELLKGRSAAYVAHDPQMPEFAHGSTVQLVGQQLNVPVVNGHTASLRTGYGPKMRPREVLEKGTRFDFTGFAYLLPVSEEVRMREEMRRAGLSLVRRGRYFALYQPYGEERGYDVDFQIIGAPPQRLRPKEQAPATVLVTNRSLYPWQPFGLYPTWPAYHLLNPETGRVIGEGARTPMENVLFPGESAVVQLTITAPERPGRYIIRLAAVQERGAWFGPRDPARIVQFRLHVE
ncbi:MAG: hypothetical protein AAB225_04200, partial [Acidobacteriota bacterium]